jgi:hypothetical protein
MEQPVHEPTPSDPARGSYQPFASSPPAQPRYGEYSFDAPRLVPPPPPSGPPRRRGRWIAAAVVLALVVAASCWTFANRQYIVDQAAIWSYDVSPTVAGYVERSAMNDRGEFLFLASRPSVATADRFESVCGSSEAGAGILGCYVPSEQTIVLFDVTNERLDGIEEVVASHEMLHAAWDRLGSDERARLTALLEAEAAALSVDTAFTERVAVYGDLDAAGRVNELHSIIGTEVGTVSPELEEYYARYFTDRAILIALHVASNAVFVELESRAATLSAELDALRASIDADYASYNAGYDILNADVEDFNARAETGGFTRTQFDRAYESLIARQSDLDALYVSIGARSDEFEAKRTELESLNTQTVELNASLNIEPRVAEPTG